MYRVTLISTEHMEFGNCNSDELLKIVNSIEPEVIFEEEHNDDHYQNYYNNENSFNSLEVKTIKKYKAIQDIIHIPVDKPINEFVSLQILNILTKVYKQNDNYRQLVREHCELRNKYGFDYLNSEKCLEQFQKMKLIEEQIILKNEFQKLNLKEYRKLFQQELDLRENTMLENIHRYSNSNKFNQAIFFLGYAHRESMIKKILKRNSNERKKINWTFYNGKENKTGS